VAATASLTWWSRPGSIVMRFWVGGLAPRSLGCDDPVVSAAGLIRSPRAVVIIASGVVVMGILAALAVRADSEAPQANAWLTTMDVAVGVAFAAAGAAAGGPLPERVLVAAVGPAWLAGSFLLAARSLHQLVLAVALVVFPSGRVRGLASWLLVGLADLAGLQLLPQLGVVALFAAVAVVAVVRFGRDLVAAWYPAAAAAAVAVVLAASWTVTNLPNGTFDPTLVLLGYELVLSLVAVAFPLAVRAVMRARARMADRLLSDQRFAGLDGLAVVLGEALDDRDLRVYRWHEGDGAYVDARGQRVIPSGERQWLTIGDLDRPVAAVAHRASALDDPATAAAVSSAVRLAVTNLRLQEEQQARLRELEAARARIIAAADRQREQAAAALRVDVDAPLRAAHSELLAVRSAVRGPEASAAFEVVMGELEAASREIAGLVAGTPPADLGDGRLRQALDGLATASPVPVTVAVAGDAAADQETETALFYVCCEALANAVKHAHAKRVAITVQRLDGGIVATVSDDGRGGADPSGSGLQGLADRLAARRGRLRVDSPPGAGTTVTAMIPD
jgi:signal transduction histidine kinase